MGPIQNTNLLWKESNKAMGILIYRFSMCQQTSGKTRGSPHEPYKEYNACSEGGKLGHVFQYFNNIGRAVWWRAPPTYPTDEHTKHDHNSAGLRYSLNWRCEGAKVYGLPSCATTENIQRHRINHTGANIAETETTGIHLLGGKLCSTNIEGCRPFGPPDALLVVYFQQHPRPNGGVCLRAV